MGQRGLARQANGKLISNNENALRSHCKACTKTIYVWQEAVWRTGKVLGLCHANAEDCDV